MVNSWYRFDSDWGIQMAVALYLQRYRAERKRKAIAYLGGQCRSCGTTDDLQFDHVDRSTKICDVTSMIRSSSWSDIQAELGKCQLLCRSCHQAKTATELRIKTHGRVNQFRRGCRCELCVQKMRILNKKYKEKYLNKRQRRVLSFQGEAPAS